MVSLPRKTKHNSLTNSELLNQVNPENKRLKRDFLNYLKSTEHSPGTIYGYSHDIDIWCVWNLQHNDNKSFVDMKKRELVDFQSWLLFENGNSPARVRRIKSALSSWSNAIEAIMDNDYEDFRPIIRKVESPKNRTVREKTVFSDEQIEHFLQDLIALGKYEQACAVALAAFSGRRKAELSRFKTDWFSEENVIFGSLYKTPVKVKTKGAAGGKMLHLFTLKNEFQPYLDLFMEYRRAQGIESEWLLFDPANPAGPIRESTLNSWAISFSAMLHEEFYWHSLRHYFTSHLSRCGLPDNAIQLIIGWSSSDLVQIYNDNPQDDQLSQYFDAGGIKKDDQVTNLTANSIFGWNLSPGRGEDGFRQAKDARTLNPLEDKQLSELCWDLLCVLQSYEGYSSGDLCHDDYLTDVQYFKNKWLMTTPDQLVKREIDLSLEEIRKDLYKSLLMEPQE